MKEEGMMVAATNLLLPQREQIHTMSNVLLLREPSSDSLDRYEVAFRSENYHPLSVPVLETVHTNISRLRDIIQKGPQLQGIQGVVITSKRSCDAWKEALQLLQEGRNTTALAVWCSIPIYVVGQTTETALREVFSTFGLPEPDIRGQTSGNAGSLGLFILDDLRERPAKLLYLTGDKNRDTISRILTDGGISLELLRVYETRGSSIFESSLSAALASSPKYSPEARKHWWIVFFAPSAAAFVMPILRKYFYLEDESLESAGLLPSKIAAIGPTTDAFLRDDLHLRVAAMAQRPTPEDLISVIKRQDDDDP
ncbi:unnamed protein product [Cyclocybe aegerita]|uniref:Tetrapyrrole biosynthesis uroporphyrinogen III synthase domain-containing protein n=1 Tax=Cyclocybe aegerita TaxID=1973307 RepID=A0A8S0WQ47_CYCAE|nr:unnamed protein product [Cyclocybe aegerita]